MRRDETYAALGATADRPLRHPQDIQDHVLLSMEESSEHLRVCLRAGFTLHFDKEGKDHITFLEPKYVGAWAFNAELLQRQAIDMCWPL